MDRTKHQPYLYAIDADWAQLKKRVRIMIPRFITKSIHAYLDYPVALALVALPLVLGLGNENMLAFWLSVATGIAAFGLTILTDHHLGLVRVLPYSLHLAVDGMVGVIFIVAPLALGFVGLDFWYYTALGLTVLAVVGLHKPEDYAQPA